MTDDAEKSAPNSAQEGPQKSRTAGLTPWRKGQSGNPGGRPRGLASRVREATRDGEDLVEFMLNVLNGKIKATPRDRIESAKWLADRGFGRSVEVSATLTAQLDSSGAVQGMADDQLEQLARQLSGGSTVGRTVTPLLEPVNYAESQDDSPQDS